MQNILEILYELGPTVEGVFREEGNATLAKELRKNLEMGHELKPEDFDEPHVLALSRVLKVSYSLLYLLHRHKEFKIVH